MEVDIECGEAALHTQQIYCPNSKIVQKTLILDPNERIAQQSVIAPCGARNSFGRLLQMASNRTLDSPESCSSVNK